MNLHAMVRGAIGAINPNQEVAVLMYIGYTVGDSGQVTPTYETIYTTAQVQPVPDQSLNQTQNANQTGITRSFYLNGDFRSLNREQKNGGDMIIWNDQRWLITSVDEGWSQTAGWTKVTGVLQLQPQPDSLPNIHESTGTWFDAEELGSAQ